MFVTWRIQGSEFNIATDQTAKICRLIYVSASHPGLKADFALKVIKHVEYMIFWYCLI